MFLALDQQYLDMSQPVKILGPKGALWKHLDPQAVAGMWDVRAKNASEKAVVEQGHDTRIVFKATRPPSFTGTAKARLMGLPAKVESGVVDLAAGAESLEFQVRVAADAAPGKHETVFCRLEVPVGDAWMIHQTPATSLRIDKPLPEGVAAKSEAPR
jgi:hypothetical protein